MVPIRYEHQEVFISGSAGRASVSDLVWIARLSGDLCKRPCGWELISGL
jgi:hypothetical protein